MKKIEMVDLRSQYLRLQHEIDQAISGVLESSDFIQGREVARFSEHLSNYLHSISVVTCGNGTDALQLALMALDLQPGDEVIIPAFTYIAAVEAVALTGLKPVLVDVDERTFNIDVTEVRKNLTVRTRAIIPVHLFGQCANMSSLMAVSTKTKVALIEDAAQSLGATYMVNGTHQYAGTMGRVGITSFFPTKILGCFGDGGAVLTRDPVLAGKIRMIANHGQRVKYSHELVGINSRLDTIQASVLDIKLRHINDFVERRQHVAAYYEKSLTDVAALVLPYRDPLSTHVYHQYTIQADGRDGLQAHLRKSSVPSMVYYPKPVHLQPAYKHLGGGPGTFPTAEKLAKNVISLPIHTEMESEQMEFICDQIRQYYNA